METALEIISLCCMRYLLLILILLPIFSCSQIRELIKEYPSNIKAIDDQGLVNSPDEEEVDLLMGCNEELATVDWKEWKAYLLSNLILDDRSLDTIPAGTYTVFVRFVVDKKGKISDVSVFKDPGFGLGQRVKMVLDKYQGCWQPARINGRTTFSYRTQPVTFTVEEADECDETVSGELIL